MPRAKILVVDDEPGMLRAVERILGDHDVGTAASGAVAIEIAAKFKPDLVICDISMPRMDGFEVMRQIRAKQEDVDSIFMTGMAEPDMALVRAVREEAFYFVEKPFNREVLRTLVERCLELRRLRQAERANQRRMERELHEARGFQQTMLPPPNATIEGIEIAARYVACSELCGDVFDYAPAGEGRAAVLVADVSGHGVSAALLTAVVTSAFRSAAAEEYDPQAVVRRVVEGIRSFSHQRFVTLIAARIDRVRNELVMVNAGHPPAMLRHDGEIVLLEDGGPIISPAFVDQDWEPKRVEMCAGDVILLYTDGIIDAQCSPQSPTAGERFRTPRLRDLLLKSKGGDSLVDGVLEAVRAFAAGRPMSDDLTLLTARFD